MAEIALYGGNIAFFGPGPGGFGDPGGFGGPGGFGHGGHGAPPGGDGGSRSPYNGFLGYILSTPHPSGGDGGEQKDPKKDKKSLVERIGEFLADLFY